MNDESYMIILKIEGYSFGEMIVDGRHYKKDLILYKENVRETWCRERGHDVNIGDIDEYLHEFNPEILIFGTGKFGLMKVSSEVYEWCASNQVRLMVEKTGIAWRSYNKLAASKNVLGAFHLTC